MALSRSSSGYFLGAAILLILPWIQSLHQTRGDSLAGRPVHASVVALSELYNATLADRITGMFGIEWEARERGRDRNPAWELAPVPEELVAEFSSRTRQIEEEKTRLIDAYIKRHERESSATTVLKLRAQATLATRPEKHVQSLADLTVGWRQRADTLLGEDATGWARTLTATGTLTDASAPAISWTSG